MTPTATATPGSFIERIASVADHPDDDADLRLRKHALAVTAAGLVPASMGWVLIGYVIDRPLLSWGSAVFALILVACSPRWPPPRPLPRWCAPC